MSPAIYFDRNTFIGIYTSQMDIHYGARLFLGALAGPVIGYFIAPEGALGVGSLSPMAVSFVVGYNIEVLFAAMDRVISSISKISSAPVKQR